MALVESDGKVNMSISKSHLLGYIPRVTFSLEILYKAGRESKSTTVQCTKEYVFSQYFEKLRSSNMGVMVLINFEEKQYRPEFVHDDEEDINQQEFTQTCDIEMPECHSGESLSVEYKDTGFLGNYFELTFDAKCEENEDFGNSDSKAAMEALRNFVPNENPVLIL